jgi:hypothetical protein
MYALWFVEVCWIWGSHSSNYEECCSLGCNVMQVLSEEYITSIFRVASKKPTETQKGRLTWQTF